MAPDPAATLAVDHAPVEARPLSPTALLGWTTVLYVLAAILICLGLALQYYYASAYSEGWGRVVGADAYNFIIIGLRGLAIMVAGLACAVVGTGCLICSVIRRDR